MGAGCLGSEQPVTSTSGIINDGSISSEIYSPDADYNYKPNLNCVWTISPASTNSITIDFNKFDLSPGDNLVILDNSLNEIVTLSGSTIPSQLEINSPIVYLNFITDDNNNGGLGWEISYTTNFNCPLTTITEGSNTCSEIEITIDGDPIVVCEVGETLNNGGPTANAAPIYMNGGSTAMGILMMMIPDLSPFMLRIQIILIALLLLNKSIFLNVALFQYPQLIFQTKYYPPYMGQFM
ncbi:MAG: CUB domain-containing protein [Saprospiraceae bacterium]